MRVTERQDPDSADAPASETVGRVGKHSCLDRRNLPVDSAERVNRRILWGAEDIIRNRPPLSRWHPDYADEFAAFLASPSPFRQG